MQDPICPNCNKVNDRWHDNYKWVGKYKINPGAFIELTCHECRHIYIGWMGNFWWNTFPREEAQDITA